MARLSITFDRGTEFAYDPLLKQKLGIDSYFCKPQAPWQKGSVENTNGRVRRFLSRDTDIAALPGGPCSRSVIGSMQPRANAWAIARPKRS
jgi:IS30 family transposase